MFRQLNILCVTVILSLAFANVTLAKKGSNANIYVNEIKISGNAHYSNDALKETMFTKESHWWKKQKFMPALFEDDLRSIIAFYNNRGYLDASIRGWDSTYVEPKRINLKIVVSEGAQYHVGSITFSGNKVFPDPRLHSHLEIKENDPFSFLKLSRSNWNLVNMYANAGYLDAEVDPRITTNHVRIDIRFNIVEGKPVYADTILIKGLEKTKPYVVKRELKIKKKELVTHSRIVQSQQNLYKTGLFNSVYINPARDSVKTQYRPVTVKVVESEAGEFNAGVGYGSKEHLRLSAELLQGNFLGTGQRIGSRVRFNIFDTKLGIQNIKLEGLYTAPHFIFGGVRLDNSTYYQRDVEVNYTLNRIGSELTIGKDIFRHSRIYSTTKIENNSFSKIDTASVLDTTKSRIRSISLNLIRDTRDNLFNPTHGSYVKLSGLLAGAIFQGTDEFYRTTFDYMRYIPYRSTVTFATNLSLGALFEFGKTQSIPIYERFYAGGDQTIRGFGERQVGPMRAGQPVGGNYRLIFRNELRFKVYKQFHTAVFADVGNVWNNITLSKLQYYRIGVGFGFRYTTPVGVARLDFGFKVRRKSGEKIGKIHLTLGQAF